MTLSKEMKTLIPSFQLAESIPPNGLAGRNCGCAIATGTNFNRLRKTRFFGGVQELLSEEVGDTRTIELTIDKIEAYGTSLDELSTGMTALLRFSGESLGAIVEELSSLSPREYLTIEAG